MPEISSVELGAVAILFAISIREFFGYLKAKKQSENGDNGGMNAAILRELQSMNQNHLTSLKEVIADGNERLIDVMHQDNTKIIELLGEVKGRLKL